jgi:hypothetical protein
LYAGVWGFNDDYYQTASIYRSANGNEWEQVFYEVVNGAADLIVFRNQLYMGTWDGHIYRSADGQTWQEVISDGFGNYYDGGIAHFALLKNYLYASTWSSTGTKIWRTNDGLVWEQFVDAGLNDINNVGAIGSEVFKGRLYWGVGNWATCAGQIWRTDGTSIEAIVTDGFGDFNNCAISSLVAYNDYLYAGVWNPNGVQVWRSEDGTTWSQVMLVDDAFYTEPISALEVYNEKLYIIVQNFYTGVEVWRTANGLDWEQVGFAGFGDQNNITTYWDNGTTVFKGRLYTGISNFWTGGEIWKLWAEDGE